MLKQILVIFTLFIVMTSMVVAHDDMSKPDIKVESRLNEKGKKIPYMYIDGVLVHETDSKKQAPPPVVTPGNAGGPPSDAVVLFDGTPKSLENWTDSKGRPTKWKLVDGTLESVKKAGMIETKQKFGSCQLHVEWAVPDIIKKDGQKRGNSGVFMQGTYEIQILDSYNCATYPDGQAGALYGRNKPLVNACREAGEWQSYDIIFHRPLFDDQGDIERRATFTVLHNGVLVQDHTILSGGTDWNGAHSVRGYKAHADRLPIKLQDHGDPVRFRNIWIRELDD